MDNLEFLTTLPSSADGQFLKVILEMNGISATIQKIGSEESSGVEIYIPKKDLERAKKMIEDEETK